MGAVERAGRDAPATNRRVRGHAPTLGRPAARSLSGLDLLRGLIVLLAVCLVGAVLWALVIFALIGALL